MQSLHARHALLPSGWAENVRLQITNGCFEKIEADTDAAETDEKLGIVIPGMVNAHSHAFQRLLVGHAEKPSPDGEDNFWGWRERMYQLVQNIEPDMMYAIACQLFTEMLQSGYTSVAEFHYAHNGPNASVHGNEMSRAIMLAAGDSGIRLTHIPVVYERAGFDADGPNERQKVFYRSASELLSLYDDLQQFTSSHVSVGLGIHSLRAAFPDSIDAIVEHARADDVPIHIHIAEQEREVTECLEATGTTPVQWLLDNHDLNHRWCLVHATHMNDSEISELAKSAAVVCLCPSTEANLGDGIFPLLDYIRADGRIAIGSDSQVTVNPFEELRWLEYVQRLQHKGRNLVRSLERPATGDYLYQLALEGGAHATGRSSNQLARGNFADLLVVDDRDPVMLGHTADSYLGALVFAGFRSPLTRVMVNGQWQVVDGQHRLAERTLQSFDSTVQRLNNRLSAA